MKDGGAPGKRREVEPGVDDSKWPVLFSGRADDQGVCRPRRPENRWCGAVSTCHAGGIYRNHPLSQGLVDAQAVYVNGHLVAEKIGRDDPVKAYPLPKDILARAAISTRWWARNFSAEEVGAVERGPGFAYRYPPAGQWKRSLFSGLTQVIVQADPKPGNIILKAFSKGLVPADLKIQSVDAPSVPSLP